MFQRFALVLLSSALAASAQVKVPIAAPENSSPQTFRDSHYGVRFSIPPGWELNKKDHQVSTFHLDAPSAKRSEMRAVAILSFNPFPLSTLSGALFYYSVERHTTDRECEQQAIGERPASPAAGTGLHEKSDLSATKGIQNIGGMNFTHGHNEHGQICIEALDDVYTAYRKGSCYRFDLAVNLFCSEISGAQDLSLEQASSIESQMSGILSTVALKWEKSGPHPVPPPSLTPAEPAQLAPKPRTSASPAGAS